MRRAQVEHDRMLLSRKQAEVKAAAEEAAALLKDDEEAARRRWWLNWMAVHHPDGTDPLEDFYTACGTDAPDDPDLTARVREITIRSMARHDLGREPTDAELQPYLEEDRIATAFQAAFRENHSRYMHWLDYSPEAPPWRLPPEAAARWIENYRWPPDMGIEPIDDQPITPPNRRVRRE
jgi:hypothetical protein